MDIIFFSALLLILIISLAFNLILYSNYTNQKRLTDIYIQQKLDVLEELDTLKSSKKPLTIDAQQLMHDLTRGVSIVQITPINPESIYMRSPER